MNLRVNSNLALEQLPDSGPAEADSDPRAILAALFIPCGSNILDLGGAQALRQILPPGCSYRGPAVRNGKRRRTSHAEFPVEAALQSDIIVMLGSLEHVADVETLFTHLRFCKRDIILSYHPTDLATDAERSALGFANHMSHFELARLFDRYGFRIACTAPVDAAQLLLRLTPAERLAPVGTCSVAVIAHDTNDFEARLGRSMVNSLLPGEADIHPLTFDTLPAARDHYDLVILGTGGGLFPPLFGDALLGVLARAKASIGIFGTQARELVPRAAFDRVLDRLDTWFARYEDDVLTFGRGRRNVVHAGDWLIDRFPLARSTNDEPLVVDGELGQEIALDRAITTIQRHRQVYSTVPAALLCALTSAELAAYAENPVQQPDLAAGQFRSLLIDIFGRTYPQQKFFLVDRDAVVRYKARAHDNVLKIGARLGSMLRNVAVAA